MNELTIDKNLTRSKGRSAFTLLEVMLAAMVMTMVFMGCFTMLSQSYMSIQYFRDENRANQIMQSQMEYYRTKNWVALDREYESLKDLPEGRKKVDLKSEFLNNYGNRYTCYLKITPVAGKVDDKGFPDQYNLVLEVEWKNPHNKPVARSTSTLFTKSGLNDYFQNYFAN